MAVEFPKELNLCVEILDRHVDARRDDVALLFGEERFTYGEVHANVCRAANLLGAMGLEREQRLLLMVGDLPEFVWFWFAAVRMGAVVSAVSPDAKPDELAYYLEYTRSRILVAEERILGLSVDLESARWLRGTVACGPSGGSALGGNVRRWGDVAAELPTTHTPADTLAEDVGVMLYTGGSTGFPKAVVHRHVDFLSNAHAYGLPVLGLQKGDITLSASKLFFGYALGSNLLFPFLAGATVALFPEKATPSRILEEVSRRRATVFVGVPTVLNSLVHEEVEGRGFDWSSLRLATSAGEALPPELYRRYVEKFGHEVLDGIGSAELFHVYITNRVGEVTPGSLGRVVPGYEARICDEEGREVPDGELGSLWIRGESMGLGYFLQTAATRASFRGEWFVSSDKFRRDPEGRFWYGGRTDDLLKVGGRFLSPLEVENLLLTHPAVGEVAVVGFFDDEGLVKPRAFVVLREEAGAQERDALAKELQDFVKTHLEPWKYPRQVVFVESMPTSDRGKILRTALRG
jgi:benzoate-CoA ligase